MKTILTENDEKTFYLPPKELETKKKAGNLGLRLLYGQGGCTVQQGVSASLPTVFFELFLEKRERERAPPFRDEAEKR
uniref:Uncharacterized protein n=1 Tax=Caenorhabditis tropicalis TaxID=1561998 RepID=A0A1I7T2W1_9PELO